MPTDYHRSVTGTDLHEAFQYVQATDPGAVGAGMYWLNTTIAPYILKRRNGTNSAWVTVAFDSGAENGGTDFKATGLTGATAGTRFGGATASGAPLTGTWTTGDFVVDQTGYGWVCTASGTPGTWIATGFHNPLTALGDLLVGGASGAPSRLPANTSGYVLTANGAGATPSWQAGASGGGGGTGGTGGSIVPIQTQTPSGVGSVTFSVPTGFKNLRITGALRSSQAAASDVLLFQFNGDTTAANYNSEQVVGSGASASASSASGETGCRGCDVVAASFAANYKSVFNTAIPNHSDTTFYKGLTTTAGYSNSGIAGVYAGAWLSTAAVTSVTVLLKSGTFVAGSTITLWGEADTGPVLLTANSNLIQETILSSAQATIAIPSIPQGYRDLRIVMQARGDTAATSTTITTQFNGDTGSNYDTSVMYGSNVSGAAVTGPTTSAVVAEMSANTAPANSGDVAILTIPNYSATTFQKQGVGLNSVVKSDTVSTNDYIESYRLRWRNTAAITAILLTPGAGNFAAGTVVRVYGEPAAAGGASVGTGTRLRISVNQSIPSGTATVITWNTNDQDANNQHLLNPTPGALTGTVAKTAASNQLVGTTTTFLTQVAVGQVIQVPGTATETFVVTAIADNTHLTLSANVANTATGQTATTINTAMVFRQAGMYDVEFGAYMAAISTGTVALQVRLNGSTIIAEADLTSINAAAGYNVKSSRPFQQWDYVEALVTQSSGSAVNLTADERTHFAASGRPTVVAAVPYILVQEQHAQNTAGGTFTSPAWQTRALNTTVSDVAAVSSLASNQVTLPPGWYRVKARAHGYKVGHHQLRLQNITDATTIVPGDSAYASNASDGWSIATLEGKFQLTGTKALALQHQCSVTEATDGFGTPANLTTEVYSALEVWKES